MPGTIRLGALLALLAVGVALPGCGSDEVSGEIPQTDADELNSTLAAVRTAIDSGPAGCQEAADQAEAFVQQVNLLPLDAGEELKEELRDAGNNLRTLVESECASTEPDTTTPTTSSTAPTSTASTSSTTDTTTTETSTTTTTSSTSTDDLPPQGNGNGPPNGVPPGQDGGTGGTGGPGDGDE